MSIFIDFNKFLEIAQPKINKIEYEILNEINLQPKSLLEMNANLEVVSYPTFSIMNLTDQLIDEHFDKAKQSILEVIIKNNVTEISELYFIRYDKPEERQVGFLLYFYCYSPDIKPEESK